MSKTSNETPQEIMDAIIAPSARVMCDGGGGALGHPKTWLDMGQDDRVSCKYCDQVFLLDKYAEKPAH